MPFTDLLNYSNFQPYIMNLILTKSLLGSSLAINVDQIKTIIHSDDGMIKSDKSFSIITLLDDEVIPVLETVEEIYQKIENIKK